MKKSFMKHAAKLELEGIPCGSLTMEQVIESENGKNVIQLLKKTSNDPYKLIIPFFVAYQTFDMEYQLERMGYGTNPDTEERSFIIKLATTNVIDNLTNICAEIGAERLEMLKKTLSNDEVNQ